jgi:hypothetical protein
MAAKTAYLRLIRARPGGMHSARTVIKAQSRTRRYKWPKDWTSCLERLKAQTVEEPRSASDSTAAADQIIRLYGVAAQCEPRSIEK